MEYLLLKKELALALPLNSNQSAILLQNKAAKPKFKPAPKEEEHNYSPVAKRLKVLVQDL